MILFERNNSDIDVYDVGIKTEDFFDLKILNQKDIKVANVQIRDWDRTTDFLNGYVDLFVGKNTSNDNRDIVINEIDNEDIRRLYLFSLIKFRNMTYFHYFSDKSKKIPHDSLFLYNGLDGYDGNYYQSTSGVILTGDLASVETINRGKPSDLDRLLTKHKISNFVLSRVFLNKKLSMDYDHFMFCLNNGLLDDVKPVMDKIETSEKVLRKIKDIKK